MSEINPYSPPFIEDTQQMRATILTEAMRFTYWPAILMIAQGTIVTGVFVVAIGVDLYEHGARKMQLPQNAAFLTFPFAPILIWCGAKLKHIESRRYSYLGAVLSAFLFLPLGGAICIWAIMALNRPVVREAFRLRELHH